MAAENQLINAPVGTIVKHFAGVDEIVPGSPEGPKRFPVANVAGQIGAILGIGSNSLYRATWLELAAITGAYVGQRGEVNPSATGTHTDPVVGGTVSNPGIYSWETTPSAGWKWQSIDIVALKADLVAGTVPLAQLPASIIGAVSYQGGWNATTNSPAIPVAAVGNKGWYYKVTTAGTTSIDGIAEWQIGDWIISNGTIWEKVDNTETVTSVAGRIGAIVLVKGDVGLGSVDNTSDLAKPISTATQTALDLKALKTSVIDEHGIYLSRSAGILVGGYYASFYTWHAGVINLLHAEVIAGTGAVEFSIMVNGVLVYSSTSVVLGTPLDASGLAIAVPSGVQVIFYVSDVTAPVTSFVAQCSGAPS